MTNCPSKSTPLRGGFSLIEMLVVLGIIILVMGFTFSSLFRGRDTNKLLAAEQLLTDTIRQARHTARSVGGPVVVRLVPVLQGNDVVGTRVSGVTRTPIWGDPFDPPNGQALPAQGTGSGVVPGFSGNGIQPSEANPRPPIAFERGKTLVRGDRTDGFYMACRARPPSPSSSEYYPLVVLGDDDESITSQAGLSFQSVLKDQSYEWIIFGWVHGENESAGTPVRSDNHKEGRLAMAVPTHRWIDVGLLYDGYSLQLFVDNTLVARRTDEIPRMLLPAQAIHVGSASRKHSDGSIERFYANMPIDDVRLYRLGTADVGDLPSGVVMVGSIGGRADVNREYRIICHPDGRVEVYNDSTQAPFETSITLGHTLAPGTIQNAVITITANGNVSSRLVTREVEVQ